MGNLEFRCIACGTPFQVPSERIPVAGGRGKCMSCGTALVIFPDGRITGAQMPGMPMTAVAPAPPPPVDEPIWEIRLASVNPDFSPGPYRLSDIRRMVIEGRLQDNDLARVMEGDWEPIRSYPAVNGFFSEKVQIEREVHGDEDHCAVHRDQSAGWQCPKCHNYLCRDCVVNRPVIAGGAANYVCAECEAVAIVLKGKSPFKNLGNMFKK